MVGKWHQCVGCMKNLSSYHSLWRHKKTCKGAGNSSGSGLLYSTSVNRPQVNNPLRQTSTTAEGESTGNSVTGIIGSTGGEESTDCGLDIDAGISDEENMENGSGEDDVDDDDDDDDDDNFDLWENFVEFTIEMKKWSILDTLCYFLIPYYLRSGDDTYKKIMYDVKEALLFKNMSYLDALSRALEKNKQSVLTSIANVKGYDVDDCFDIWCVLAARKSKNGCRWISYLPCYCNECKGRACMISYLKYLLLMFHYMDVDDVVQDIMSSIKKVMDDDDGELTLCDASHIAVEKHENVILEKVREAEKEILERITMKKKDGQGMHLNPWRYK